MERLVSRVVLGAMTPVSLLLLGWWGTLGALGDSPLIPWVTLGGFLLGVALDLTVLRPRLDSLYSLSTAALAGIAVFYSVMIFGFFMGFPVPLLLVAAGWGFAATRSRGDRAGQGRNRVRAAAFGSALIMFVACCATAWLAFNEPSIASQVRGMLGLSVTPSMGQLRVLSLAGGLGLTASAYGLAAGVASWATRSVGV